MEWAMIIGFIILGIILIVVEIIFVPGTTIVGIAGLLISGYGVYLTYESFGSTAGNTTLIITGSFCVGALIYALKSRSWEKFSLQGTMEGKFNDEYKLSLKIGDIGESISSLKPIGKAIFDDRELEVRSTGGYVREKQPVKVIKITDNKIFVEPLTEADG